MLIRQLLRGRDETTLQRARLALAELLGAGQPDPARSGRVALIGLRGAGKSTLGRMLADGLGVPFVELNRIVERLAGCDVSEIHSLYGSSAYRRYEQRALEETMAELSEGGHRHRRRPRVRAVDVRACCSSHCYTVWLRASPEEHMQRVVAQGDMRPMAGNAEAMDDLKRILAGREPFYAKADLSSTPAARRWPMPSWSSARTFLRRLPQRGSAPDRNMQYISLYEP